MASSYVNDLRLNEMATGDASGSWGTNTNVNLNLISEALGYGTEGITTNANTHTSTVADGATDPVRAMYVEYTGTLDSACTITIAPNTINRMHFIENGTSGSQNIIIKQGSGATITIPPGDTKAVYLDGAGSGAKVVDAFASLNVVDLKVQDDLTVTDDVAIGGLATVGGTLGVTGIVTLTDDLIIGDGKTIGSASDVDAMTIAANGQITLTQTLICTALDIEGDIDVNGTSNLDNTDIDGTLDVSGQVTFADGSAGAPSISNTGDVNAGLFFSAADVMSFSAGGTAQFTMADGSISPVTDNDIDLGTASLKYKSFFAGLVDAENFKINGGQGSDGQVLTSTGSGVAFEDASGGATDIDGLSDAKSGGTNFSNSLFLGHQTTGTLNNANNNTAVGHGAMDAVTAGADSTAIGKDAMTTATTSDSSVAVGTSSMAATTTGNDNTAVGWRSLYANTTGPQNVAVGKGALAANTTGEANTGIGYLALTTNTTGQGEAFGANALTAQTTGSENQAFGLNALAACTTGTSNVAVGKGAFQALTTGSDSVAIGRGAGDAVTTAANNTFVGSAAGGSNTSGATNVAVGFQAATAVTTAGGTTAVGSEAGEAITTGAFNTCVGIVAGSTITTGARNLCLGYDSGTSGSPSHITTGDNGIVLGNNATASAHIKVDWTVTSDKRDKTDIEPLTMGLNFVNKLEPVTYRWDMRSDYSKDFSITPDGTHKQQKVSGGLLAQDVEKLEREYGYKVEDETAILTDKHNTNGNYGLTYSKFIPVLINAIQELSTQVETLKTKVETLKGE